MKKKVIAIVAALMMVLTLVPMGVAYADQESIDPDIPIQGPSESLEPNEIAAVNSKIKNALQDYLKLVLDENGELVVNSIWVEPGVFCFITESLTSDEIMSNLSYDLCDGITSIPSDSIRDEISFNFEPAVEFDPETNAYDIDPGESYTCNVTAHGSIFPKGQGGPIYNYSISSASEEILNKEIPIKFNYNKNVAEEKAEFIKSIDIENKLFMLTDLEVIDFMIGESKANGTPNFDIHDFSSALKNEFNNFNLDVEITLRAGQPSTYFKHVAGTVQLMYDNCCYYFGERVDVKAEHILYVDSNTANTPSSLEVAAEKRLKDYLGEKEYDSNDIDIHSTGQTVGNYIDSETAEFDDQDDQMDFLKNIRAAHTFMLEVNDTAYNIIIIPNSEKMSNPSLFTKDFSTDVSIDTDTNNDAPLTLPLDSMIQAKEIETPNSTLDIDGTHQTYDLKIYSQRLAHAESTSVNGYIVESGCITSPEDAADFDKSELQNTFKVSVPLTKELYAEYKEKGSLIAYYVTKDGKTYEYNVTVVKDSTTKSGYRGEFYTNHFSTYTLAATDDVNAGGQGSSTTTPDNSVNTGDNAMPFLLMGIMLIAVAGIFGVRRFSR